MTARTRSIVIIFNPRAGRGQAKRRRAEIETRLVKLIADQITEQDNAVHWEIVETTEAGSGEGLARNAALNGASLVVAAGGDGTLNEVLNGLMGHSTRLGLLPMGTGNDFARCIGLGTDMERAIKTLFYGTPKPIDVGQVSGRGQVRKRWFLNIAGCGFDALVAERTNRGYGFLRGRSAYIAAVCQSLAMLRPAQLKLILDGEMRQTRALMCSVANATSYGGGMKIAPNACLDDGLFDICLLHEASRLEFLLAFPRVFRGTHIDHPKVTMLRAAGVELESDPAFPVLIDGEVIGSTPVIFTLAPRAIEIMVPSLHTL